MIKSRSLIFPKPPKGYLSNENINGPTVIKQNLKFLGYPVSFYILYFADHHGDYIKLAVSKTPTGPFLRIRFWGLHLVWSPLQDRKNHSASPEVFEIGKRRYLLTHSPSRNLGKQVTYVSRLYLGLICLRTKTTILPSYTRLFFRNGKTYAVTIGGEIFSVNPTDWSCSRIPLEKSMALTYESPDCPIMIRHCHVVEHLGEFIMFFSRTGDAPERILASILNFDSAESAVLGRPLTVLRPKENFEGANLPITPSKKGKAKTREHALRDPYVLLGEQETYLYYSVAGEKGVAVSVIELDALISQLKKSDG